MTFRRNRMRDKYKTSGIGDQFNLERKYLEW
jgi:hypothetical protein